MDLDSKKVLHYTGALFLVAMTVCTVWYMLQPNQFNWFRDIKAEVTNQPYARTVTVSAEGKVTVKPDIALISLSVVSQGKTVKVVTTDGNQKMTDVINAVKNLGVDAKDVVTSSYYLSPDYVYPDNRTPQISGYRLEQGITVKVRKLETVDDVLDAGIKAGSNQVGQLSFDIDDASNIKKDARAMAFQKAKEKADEMAKDAGVKIGRVITFNEEGGYPITPYANYSMDMMKAESAVAAPAPSIEPGSKELTINVSVTYEIE
jgi:uncharacterized protein YggE